jgi:hypothetical protein
MELKDFVKQALSDLMLAVRDAASDTNGLPEHGRISPRLSPAAKEGTPALVVADDDGGGAAFLVEFDLSVVVTDADQTKASGGAKQSVASVLSIGGGGETMSADGRIVSQRIKFAVPVAFPQTAKPPRAAPAAARSPPRLFP